MFDLVKLKLAAGNGGNGRVSFRREKFVPKGGPDGGNGGDGGNIILRGTRHVNTLQSFAGVKEYAAQPGQPGGDQNKIGKRGEDLVLEVPIGTTVWLLAENSASFHNRKHTPKEGQFHAKAHFQKYYLDKPVGIPPAREPDEVRLVSEERAEAAALARANKSVLNNENLENEVDEQPDWTQEDHILRSDSLKNIRVKNIPKIKLIEFTEEGQEYLIAKGGYGGKGNDMFKSSTNTTPFEAEYGTFGDKKIVLLELKLFADVGLVGFPNAGKSTFLSIVTKANPKIANYPFTTLEPNLGVMSIGGSELGENFANRRDLVIADLPGLIEGASEGKGLGFDFLRHVQGTKILLYVLSLDENMIFDETITNTEKAKYLYEQYKVLENELKVYGEGVDEKPTQVSISKLDLYSPELRKEIQTFFRKKKLDVVLFSAITQEGIDQLKQKLSTVFEN
jgi:GTP-binding protein